MNVLRFALFALVLALLGCAAPRESALFVTRTSLGIDVDSAPTTAAIGYNRVEAYLGPRYDTGSVPAVVGSFRTDGGLFNRKVRQVYATGNAALNATGTAATATEEKEHFSGDRKAMFFGTGTVFGINIGFGDVGATSFTFGFKRKELSVIPVSSTVTSSITHSGTTTEVVHRFPSVFARLDNVTEATTLPDSQLDIKQFFATGVAAQRLANNRDVQTEFRQEARDPRLQYRDEEHQQSRLVLDTLYCLSMIPDGELGRVFGNAEALNVFKDRQAAADLRAATAPAQARRAFYTGQIRLLDPADAPTTAVLGLHRKFVCDLTGATS